MKIDLSNGTPTIDATDLGAVLDIPAADVVQHMREGRITSIFETGEGADEGRMRLTFFYLDQKVRFTCDADGTVLSQIRTRSTPSH